MAKKKSSGVVEVTFAGSAEDTVVGVAVSVMNTLIDGVRRAKGDKDDSNMVYASAWKQLKDRGANNEALKVAFKLILQERKKAQVFVRDFLEYCRYLNIWDQMELPLEHPVNFAANDETNVVRLSDGDGEQHDGSAEHDDADAIGAVGGERSDAVTIGADEIPTNAGALFNDGQEAALAGGDRDSHGLDDGSPEAGMWLQGFDSVRKTAPDGDGLAFLQ